MSGETFRELLAREAGMGGLDETGDVIFAAGTFNRLMEGADKVALFAKSKAIKLLEQRIAELEAQNTALQAHNTELLLRARTAEENLRADRVNSHQTSILT